MNDHGLLRKIRFPHKTWKSPFDGVPAGFRNLLDHRIVQNAKAKDMVAHQQNHGAEGQRKHSDGAMA
jgi:hypothetical protein